MYPLTPFLVGVVCMGASGCDDGQLSGLIKFRNLSIVVIVTLALLEVGLRVIEKLGLVGSILYEQSSIAMIEKVDSIESLMGLAWFGFRPYTGWDGFITNSRSFRTKEYLIERDAGKSRIVVLGDSFGFSSGGIPYQQHWPKLTESILQQLGDNPDLINLSVSGTGPAFAKRIWEIEGSQLEPDVLIHAFYVGNDFTDHLDVRTWSSRLIGNIRIIRLIRNLNKLHGADQLKTKRPRLKTYDQNLAGTELPEYVYQPKVLKNYSQLLLKQGNLFLEDSDFLDRHASFVMQPLADMKREAEDSNVRFIVMIIPQVTQIQAADRQLWLSELGQGKVELDLFRPQRVLKKILTENNIEFIDLLPFFLEASQGSDLYTHHESHLNVLGNRITAQVLAKRLHSNGMSGQGGDIGQTSLLFDLPGDDVLPSVTGTVKTPRGQDICAMVLASGRFMFSCHPTGVMTLTGLPRENDGTVKRQIYADGFFPRIDKLTGTTNEAVVMTRSGTCPDYNSFPDPGVLPGSAGKRIEISGKVLLQDSQTPICAMVLANGQYTFSCDGTGHYALPDPSRNNGQALPPPLDNNGQFKLQVYADGFAPVIETFDEFSPVNDVRMARAVECQ